MGKDTPPPPVFVQADQNFPTMVPAGREGECTIKIVQVENGSLSELVEVFLGLTRGFDMPAGAVVLLSSPSHASVVGTADCATEFGSSGAPSWAGLRCFTVSHSSSVALTTPQQLGHWWR